MRIMSSKIHTYVHRHLNPRPSPLYLRKHHSTSWDFPYFRCKLWHPRWFQLQWKPVGNTRNDEAAILTKYRWVVFCYRHWMFDLWKINQIRTNRLNTLEVVGDQLVDLLKSLDVLMMMVTLAWDGCVGAQVPFTQAAQQIKVFEARSTMIGFVEGKRVYFQFRWVRRLGKIIAIQAKFYSTETETHGLGHCLLRCMDCIKHI